MPVAAQKLRLAERMARLGTEGAFEILALVEEGEEVLYPNPGFPIYESMIQFVGARPVPYALGEERDFDVDTEAVLGKITDRTKLIILNSPHNPTGGVMRARALTTLAEGLEAPGRREVFILSDEIYNRLIFDGEHASLAWFPAMKE